ncbi:hypothetical protein ACOI9R_37695, partial [Mesorhizobium japonicum]
MTTSTKPRAALMDPPYPGYGGGYDTVSLRRLRNFPLLELLAPNCHLYLWVPNGMIADGVKLAEHYGFVVRGVI